jgi:hypothetical protein
VDVCNQQSHKTDDADVGVEMDVSL